MFCIRLLLAAFALMAAIEVGPAQAQWGWPQGPWCAYMSGGSTDCGFYSFEQCRATIFGIGGFCSPNPNYVRPPARERRYPRRRSY